MGRENKGRPCEYGCGRVTRHQENGKHLCKNCRSTPVKKAK